MSQIQWIVDWKGCVNICIKQYRERFHSRSFVCGKHVYNIWRLFISYDRSFRWWNSSCFEKIVFKIKKNIWLDCYILTSNWCLKINSFTSKINDYVFYQIKSNSVLFGITVELQWVCVLTVRSLVKSRYIDTVSHLQLF